MTSTTIKRGTFGKPPVASLTRLREHDNKPSPPVSTSQVKSGGRLFVRQTVDKNPRSKPETVRHGESSKKIEKTESQTQASRKPPLPPPPLASRARRVSSAAPQSKPSLFSTTKPVLPARPVSPRTQRVSSTNPISMRSLPSARGIKASESDTTKSSSLPREASLPVTRGTKASEPKTSRSSLPLRKASILATQQVRRNISEMRRPSVEELPVTQAKVHRRSLLPVKRPIVKRSSSRLEAPLESQDRQQTMFLSQVLLERLPIQDMETSYKVEELGSERNQVVILTPLREKTEVLIPEEREKGPSTPVSRVLESESRASCEPKVDNCDEISSQRGNNGSNNSLHERKEGSRRKRLLEEFLDVTPSAFKRDRDVTFETEVRPRLKRQRFMVTLPFHFEESLHDADNTQFFTPEKAPVRDIGPEREVDQSEEAPEEALMVVPCEDHNEEMEVPREAGSQTIPCTDQNGKMGEAREAAFETLPCEKRETEQTASSWGCSVM